MQPSSKTALGPVDNSESPRSALRTVPLDAVQIRDGFWARRQSVNRAVSLKHGYEMLEKAGNFHNLRMAAGWETGEYAGRNFYDEDVYKWLEALGWELGRQPDAGLHAMADEVIALIAAAQEPDGYLDSYYQVVEPERKWKDLDFSHELYCAGHFFQAAIAFQRALGDDRLMRVAIRLADHIDSVFGPGKNEGTCGHPEVEMALVELYRTTGNEKYLRLAQFFVDQRGQRKMKGLASYGPEYHQDHLPVRQAGEAIGHAVRQMYLSAAVADLYMEKGEPAMWEASERLWQDVTSTKLYITGGVGARYDGEAFGDPYELPSDQCYCETCAAIGSLMWNWRLLLITGESRYADLVERTLYNGILSSPALDGRHFFYVNPLMLRDERSMRLSTNPDTGSEVRGRPEWHEVACCPPNVMRLFSSLAHYLTTTSPAGIQIHQYAPADIRLEFAPGRSAALRMETGYPWQGQVSVVVNGTHAAPWALRLRIPEWSRSPQVTINGEQVAAPSSEKGYLVFSHAWKPGDRIQLDLGMEPELVEANPRVDATRGCLAIQRGPLVYCLEAVDNSDASLMDVQIDETAPLEACWRENLLPEGVMAVEAGGRELQDKGWQGRLYRPAGKESDPGGKLVALTAIPYYAWANRSIRGMRVWIPKVDRT